MHHPLKFFFMYIILQVCAIMRPMASNGALPVVVASLAAFFFCAAVVTPGMHSMNLATSQPRVQVCTDLARVAGTGGGRDFSREN